MDKNPYSWINKEVGERQRLKMAEEAEQVNRRMWRLFHENEEGRILLADWSKNFIFHQVPRSSPSLYDLGVRDGQAHIPKVIIHAINEVTHG